MASTRHTILRRLAPVLAVLQLAAFGLGPVAESLFERPPGPPSVEAGHERCAPLHQAATCPFCALASTRARPAERVQLAVPTGRIVVAEAPAPPGRPSLASSHAVRTRAPPSHAV